MTDRNKMRLNIPPIAVIKKQPKIKISKPKSLKKICDDLWAQVIKARAGYKSELSGKTEQLHSHHIAGKPNYRLRYELDNGICITAGEHFFGIHHTGRQKEYERRIKSVKGTDIYERLEKLSGDSTKTNLAMVKLYLEQELKRY